jgi:hypothetical protein
MGHPHRKTGVRFPRESCVFQLKLAKNRAKRAVLYAHLRGLFLRKNVDKLLITRMLSMKIDEKDARK